ncbi:MULTISPECIES: 2-oxo-4-hydroxy-4-carboxy-5-ureidoimidazoline decarboxylase [unclassified Rhizobium]|uniref:2-oxo-4-hydroxy-4-carboxy-5-ureidoimidazoline decarboxylase n=1 Tax=unclassified Rhizobium TaxID=2613769 RepID=UPI0006FBBAD7|nr:MULTISPECIES: 2-oxo-4-hydroxy-4-carboxy-5-ureidoimidazoline decarboxylase [unclassified Rhizobium]KQV41394.1 hypothetical protein ASC86_20520 [Rhizobium sp. Root1212]KRD37028.1 hypothetical protein ASE37_19205 [Rhizobium sp. Root268]
MSGHQVTQGVGTASQAPAFDRVGFVEAFGTCFRNGDSIAGRAFDAAVVPLEDAGSIFAALRDQFRAASDTERMEVLKAYTPLDPAVKTAEIVADESQSSGLRAMTAGQQARLLELLSRYTEKFGFDVIFAVRKYTTASLIASFEKRILDSYEAELKSTFAEVEQLAEILVKARFL